MGDTYRKVELSTGLRESAEGWYGQRLEDYDQDISRKGNNGCSHGEYFSQETPAPVFMSGEMVSVRMTLRMSENR